jgi:S-adenosylmethionine:tRNA ribosyltransferase-isomerase
MRIDDFDYELPKNLIAQYPSDKRDESNLLVLHRETGRIEHRKFYDLADYLGPGDVLILNETKVFPARLMGKRIDTGGNVEVFLLRPLQSDPDDSRRDWVALVSPRRARKAGIRVQFGPDFQGEVKSIAPETVFEFDYTGDFDALLNRYGQVPLPPYIKRDPEPLDCQRYQTVYAKASGACAAPTAGLHFTDLMLSELRERGVETANLILHTGLGTFKPVKRGEVEDHEMESEYYEIPEEVTRKINAARRRVAVGTTTVRALESGGEETLSLQPRKGWTDRFIYPPYKFRMVDALITNFHLPKTTLLLLVCAFAGKENIFRAYEEAVDRGYRFYSYGDAMLIL